MAGRGGRSVVLGKGGLFVRVRGGWVRAVYVYDGNKGVWEGGGGRGV